jgi:4-hydroxy-tetrahydrodipicolinate reductase
MVTIAIVGACGRMGRRLGELGFADNELKVVCALEDKGHPEMGKDYGRLLGGTDSGILVSSELTTLPNVLIDFSAPESTAHWVKICQGHNVNMVIGTTGLNQSIHEKILAAGRDIAIVHAPNMSVGVNLLFRLAGQIAKSLGPDYDIEIVEAHHRYKKDAPSGTALGLLKSICEGTGASPDQAAVYGRHGVGQARRQGEIGVHAIRLGDTVGEHVVYFGTPGETVSIAHSAHSRDTFASGALRAAKWVAQKNAGLYSMQDVLFTD